jgi:integrase
MPKHSAENARIKHRYGQYLKEARRQSEASIDKAMAAIAKFEAHNRNRSFKKFRIEQALSFKRALADTLSEISGKALSAATRHATLAALRMFFIWLADQPGYRAAVRYADAEYFNASERDRAIATTKREKPAPRLDQIRHVLNTMSSETGIQRRDRAVIALTILTGARDGAIASMKLRHVDIERGVVYQDAREVRTKFAKTITTSFFPVGDDIRAIVSDWVRYLLDELHYGDDDPLFPATLVAVGPSRKFEAVGLDRVHWSNANRIRAIFRDAFSVAGLQYFNPHSFRNTLTLLGEELCHSMAEFKAWSQNLGHADVTTTMNSYGAISAYRQIEIIRKLSKPQGGEDATQAKLMAALEEWQRSLPNGPQQA